MIKYLALPEMEVERIFNNVRYKYLLSIYHSGLENPQQYMSAKYNHAFQSLAGIIVYQGSTKDRKDNDYFWKSVGFKCPQKTGITFLKERNDLKFILNYLRSLKLDNYFDIYKELIAIKPGFHELIVHPDFFDENYLPKGKDLRSRVLRSLRGDEDLKEVQLDRLPHEINSKSYFTYASCNITEGPFVFRKSIETSYYDELNRIETEEDIKYLKKKFCIIDYYNCINSLEKLEKVLYELKIAVS